ncbi:hypothetical protein HHX47_DHR1000171 [Lentinula edodes]|nr:hypothetical protein HHX47_DHR1000171 [Lentinula edodes]
MLQEQLREVRKGFITEGILTGGLFSKTGNMAGLFGQAPRVMIEDTRGGGGGGGGGGPSPVVPQPRSWQAMEPISFTRHTPMGVREGNPQEGQTVPLPATPSVDRRHIQEWGARVQRAELGEYVRPEGGRYTLEDGGIAASEGGKGGFNLPDRVPPPHLSSHSRDREQALSQGGWDQRGQEGRSRGGPPPPPPTGAPVVPQTRYDPDQPWYYDPRQGWHRNAAPRLFNEGWNTWESNEEKNRITIGKIKSFTGDDCSAWKTWVLSLERMFGVHPTIYA